MSLKDQFLSLQSKLKIEPVTIEGMTEPVYVRTLTGRERDAFEASCFQQKGKNREINTENLRAKLLVRSICDADGQRLFTDADVNLLGNMPADVLDTLFAKAQELSGLGTKDVEEMVGN
jgi:hypothetical protein